MTTRRRPKRLTHEQFTLHAIRTLRDTQKSLGVHTVISGFNAAFRIYFPDDDPVQAIEELHRQKKVIRAFRPRGAMIYLPTELPSSVQQQLAIFGDIPSDPGMAVLQRMGLTADGKPKITHEEFTLLAIRTFRDPARSVGIHTVYNYFNQGFRKYFPGDNPVEVVDELHRNGKVVRVFVRGGARIYLPTELPPSLQNQHPNAYGQIVRTRGMRTLRGLGLSDHVEQQT